MHAEFVPLRLYKRNREDLLLNTTPLSWKLYNAAGNAVVTFDATYVFSKHCLRSKVQTMNSKRNRIAYNSEET